MWNVTQNLARGDFDSVNGKINTPHACDKKKQPFETKCWKVDIIGMQKKLSVVLLIFTHTVTKTSTSNNDPTGTPSLARTMADSAVMTGEGGDAGTRTR